MTTTSLLHGIPLYLKGAGSTAYQAFISAVLDRLGPTYGADNVDHLGMAYLAGPMVACPGVPAHALDLACAYAQTAASLASVAAVAPYVVDRRDVARLLYLPLVIAASTGTAPAVDVEPPVAVAGGFVHADLLDEDRELFMVLLGQLDGDAGPEQMAALAQGFRLPVTPYRAPGHGAVNPAPVIAALDPGAGMRPLPGLGEDRPLAGVVVVDHTVLWAGPLCTWLLAELGATVIKIEPASRPDGYRKSPGGHVFAALDRGKSHQPLDLSRPVDRRTYLELIAEADLVVDNLSGRARANLGIDREDLAGVNPDVLTLSLPAFTSGEWVSYGVGVHAALGLGSIDPTLGQGPVAGPVIAYPDPLTGLAGLVAALGLLVGRAAGNPAGRAVVSIESATAPLLGFHDGGRSLLSPAHDIGARLAADLEPGAYPGIPFRLIEDDETWDTAEQAATSAWDAPADEEIPAHQRETLSAITALLRPDSKQQ